MDKVIQLLDKATTKNVVEAVFTRDYLRYRSLTEAAVELAEKQDGMKVRAETTEALQKVLKVLDGKSYYTVLAIAEGLLTYVVRQLPPHLQEEAFGKTFSPLFR